MATNQWIDPPQRPDDHAIERLRAACRDIPRISELWITGSRFTRDDGTSKDSTGIALVLDPPERGEGRDDGAVFEMIAKLDAVWPTDARRSWLSVTRATIDAHTDHCLPVYAKA